MEMIQRAYQAENLPGSYCTAPLCAYNTWFQNKIEVSDSAFERTAWTISHVVSGIFAYLTLGVLALVGIAVNLYFIPPENGYSLWARVNEVPEGTERYCEEIRRNLSLMEPVGAFVCTSSSRPYTYDLHKWLAFDVQDSFEGAPLPLEERERRKELHIVHSQNVVRMLSQQHNWYPEALIVNEVNGRATLNLMLPDHIPIPDAVLPNSPDSSPMPLARVLPVQNEDRPLFPFALPRHSLFV